MCDATCAVLRVQFKNKPFAGLQASLKRAWLNFTRQFGPINHTKTTVRVDAMTGAESKRQHCRNLQPFLYDPDVWLVSLIARYDEETDTAEPGPLFTDHVIQAPSEPEIHSVHDALAVCLHEGGAREAAACDARYTLNVTALEAVQLDALPDHEYYGHRRNEFYAGQAPELQRTHLLGRS